MGTRGEAIDWLDSKLSWAWGQFAVIPQLTGGDYQLLRTSHDET